MSYWFFYWSAAVVVKVATHIASFTGSYWLPAYTLLLPFIRKISEEAMHKSKPDVYCDRWRRKNENEAARHSGEAH